MYYYFDVIIIGAGASGLMCAIEAGKRGKNVLVVDQAAKAGLKILASGGGKCNFTNYHLSSDNYISNNPHFCKSAISRFNQWDFIELIQKHKIQFSEREHGQLFCNDSSRDILSVLLAECKQYSIKIQLSTEIQKIEKPESNYFNVFFNEATYNCKSLVIATGSSAMPTLGATTFGYKIAEQFKLNIIEPRPGLVPFTFQPEERTKFAELAGIAVEAIISNSEQSFRENILFTHRGISGPAVLQISNYWQQGEEITINFLPDIDFINLFKELKLNSPEKTVKTILSGYLPKRLVETLIEETIGNYSIKQLVPYQIVEIAEKVTVLKIKPNGTEGFRTAEVTLGGVDCSEISSKTFEANKVKGLYFIGEVLDVTGWLGGYNLQWAWSSGWCAGQWV